MRKTYTIKISEEEVELFKKAAKIAYNENKHRKDYGVSAFLKESASNRAKRIIK